VGPRNLVNPLDLNEQEHLHTFAPDRRRFDANVICSGAWLPADAGIINRAMDILFLDDSFAYDSYSPRNDAMGGPEKGLVYLAETLVRRGHNVVVRNRCERELTLRGVHWKPLDDDPVPDAHLTIALRHPRLLDLAPAGGKRALWVTSPGGALTQGAAAEALAQHADASLIFMGETHRATWFDEDSRAVTIQPGVAPAYLASDKPAGFWPPRAVVTTHPKLGMDWLLELWCRRIEPLIKGAQMHIFSGTLRERLLQTTARRFIGVPQPQRTRASSFAARCLMPTWPRSIDTPGRISIQGSSARLMPRRLQSHRLPGAPA
jgi:hypothetical protein